VALRPGGKKGLNHGAKAGGDGTGWNWMYKFVLFIPSLPFEELERNLLELDCIGDGILGRDRRGDISGGLMRLWLLFLLVYMDF
jgi:hypothetical protein